MTRCVGPLVAVFGLAGCSLFLADFVTVRGQTVDGLTEAPVPATVEVYRDRVGQDVLDEREGVGPDGRFSIEVIEPGFLSFLTVRVGREETVMYPSLGGPQPAFFGVSVRVPEDGDVGVLALYPTAAFVVRLDRALGPRELLRVVVEAASSFDGEPPARSEVVYGVDSGSPRPAQGLVQAGEPVRVRWTLIADTVVVREGGPVERTPGRGEEVTIPVALGPP